MDPVGDRRALTSARNCSGVDEIVAQDARCFGDDLVRDEQLNVSVLGEIENA